jgi:transglutaminase-like putative cysteine protease
MTSENKAKLVIVLIIIALFAFNSKQSVSGDYLSEEPDILFTPDLRLLAIDLKGTDDFETTKNVLKYVATNIKYDSQISIPYCFTETSQSVYETGKGDCVSMTRLTAALLRLNEIPVKTVGGCINFRYSCVPAFSVIGLDFNDIPVSEIIDEKKRGYLHEWSEAYIDGTWYLLESTAGLVLPNNCVAYKPLSESTNTINRCIVSNQQFINECRAWN